MTKHRVFAVALACAAAASLSACNGLGGIIGAPGATPAAAVGLIKGQLDSINSAAAQNCVGVASISWHPPLPPSGALDATCRIGPQMVPLSQVQQLIGQGGSFGGGGATITTPAVPPAQLPAELQAAVDAAVAKALAPK